jgi:hypothetical protein
MYVRACVASSIPPPSLRLAARVWDPVIGRGLGVAAMRARTGEAAAAGELAPPPLAARSAALDNAAAAGSSSSSSSSSSAAATSPLQSGGRAGSVQPIAGLPVASPGKPLRRAVTVEGGAGDENGDDRDGTAARLSRGRGWRRAAQKLSSHHGDGPAASSGMAMRGGWGGGKRGRRRGAGAAAEEEDGIELADLRGLSSAKKLRLLCEEEEEKMVGAF